MIGCLKNKTKSTLTKIKEEEKSHYTRYEDDRNESQVMSAKK